MDAHHHRHHQYQKPAREKSVDSNKHGTTSIITTTSTSTSAHHHQEKLKPAEAKDVESHKSVSPAQKQQVTISSSSSSPPSPPSASSSPSHEFSFTISLHSASKIPNNAKTTTTPPPSSFAVDLSPADDIFFHGHLLPLHLLSHLPAVSARSSTNSLDRDSFTLPIKDLSSSASTSSKDHKPATSSQPQNINAAETGKNGETRGRNDKPSKSSFSLFGLAKWRKTGYEFRDRDINNYSKYSSSTTNHNKFDHEDCCYSIDQDDDDDQKGGSSAKRKKAKFDVSQVLKRYMRMVRPLLFFRGRKETSTMQLRGQPYSFSGILTPKGTGTTTSTSSFSSKFNCKRDLMSKGRRGEFSAPASMRTSPSNSGLLVATASTDSTMEELQAAIQAAIAHCKNSIATTEDSNKLNC